MLDNHASIHCKPFGFVKVKYISNYMLINAKILKSLNHLEILHADA